MKIEVLVFAKAPVPGQVKTRLIPALGATTAARLHAWMTRRALATAVAAGVGPVTLFAAPDPAHVFFTRCRDRYGTGLAPQRGTNLGERLAHATAGALARADAAIVIGSDCPVLTGDDLRQAAAALGAGFDAVIGPAEDGGYVLLGLRRGTCDVYTDMPWGGSEVAALTRERLARGGRGWFELAELFDVDRPDDVARLARQHPAVRRLLAGTPSAPWPRTAAHA